MGNFLDDWIAGTDSRPDIVGAFLTATNNDYGTLGPLIARLVDSAQAGEELSPEARARFFALVDDLVQFGGMMLGLTALFIGEQPDETAARLFQIRDKNTL